MNSHAGKGRQGCKTDTSASNLHEFDQWHAITTRHQILIASPKIKRGMVGEDAMDVGRARSQKFLPILLGREVAM